MVDTPKWYDLHLPKFQEIAYVKSMDEYQDLYQRSLDDPDGFWSEQARRYLSWVDSICSFTFASHIIGWIATGA